MSGIKFEQRSENSKNRARSGIIHTPHGSFETPSFVAVGTKATVKALTPNQLKEMGVSVVLGNTYHLYLEPGEKRVSKGGGIGKYMGWNGPTMTDSGGFQVFSLGAAYEKSISKISKIGSEDRQDKTESENIKLATVSEEGVLFKSNKDGSQHFLTPEKSIGIQHDLGADIIFAFDECTLPDAPYEYQKEAWERTHRWAKRSLDEHKRLGGDQALFGVVQGGRYEDLRRESARTLGAMDFDGFGIGGSFGKEDIETAVGWVTEELPADKPRHLLGIGEPEDLFMGVACGCDTFDCVMPTRLARHGTLYTASGKIHILNSSFLDDYSPIENNCLCYTCKTFTRSYIAHLFRAGELLAYTLSSIHNLYFINNLVNKIRASVIDGNFENFRQDFMGKYSPQ